MRLSWEETSRITRLLILQVHKLYINFQSVVDVPNGLNRFVFIILKNLIQLLEKHYMTHTLARQSLLLSMFLIMCGEQAWG